MHITFEGQKFKLASPDKIPTDDPELPSYQGEAYKEQAANLDFVQDLFIGEKAIKAKGKAKTYLPPFSKEEDGEYQGRLARSLYHNFFAPAVKGFPGFLADINDLDKLYPGLVQYEQDIDLQGNNLISFLWQADLKVIRDGCCGVLVDMPRLPRDESGNKLIKTKADEKLVKLRPYLVLIDRRNIMSASQQFINGKLQLDRITIKECISQPVGTFGSETVERYRTFWSDGGYRVEVIIELNDGEVRSMVLEDGYSDLKQCPIVLYSATDVNPLEAEPPLLNLAEKNLSHLRLWSEYREIIHKMNVPVPVRVGLIQPGMPDQQIPPMILGKGVDVPVGGSFSFAELQGNVLETDRIELNALEVSMNADSLKFLAGSNGDKTATEVALESAQLQATLNGICNLKESAIEQIASLWAAYYNQADQGGTCTIDRSLLDMPLDPQTIGALSQMAVQNQLSVITLLELMHNGKRLPEDVTPALEIKRLAAQFSLRLKQQQQALKLQASIQSDSSPTNALKSKDNTKPGDTKNGQSNSRNSQDQAS